MDQGKNAKSSVGSIIKVRCSISKQYKMRRKIQPLTLEEVITKLAKTENLFVSSKKGTVKPKNALTVTYLCFAFDVPYATFKRWKIDAGITTKSDPVNKGKSVITDKNWASKIFNVRRMFYCAFNGFVAS